jgi:AcrR family transcriptional regulator
VYTPCIPRVNPHVLAPAAAVPARLARNAIIAAAAKVFARRGIAATRVEDILGAADVARRTFYRYFTGKDDVLAALFEVWTSELVRAVEDARARSPADPLAGIRGGIDLYLGFYRSGPPVLRELVELAMSSTSPLAPRRKWLRGEVVRLLDQAVRDHDGRKLDPLVYYGLLGALEGLSIELGDPATTAADVERAHAAIHAILDHTLDLPRPRPLPRRTAA